MKGFMRKRDKRAALLLGTALLLLTACGQQESDLTENMYVGVACYDQSDVYIEELLECFKEECGDRKITVTIRDAVGSQKTQNDQVKEMIGEGCGVLCVNLADRTDPSEIIDMARENDVPIVFFNREPVAEDLMQWEKLYYVGADAQQSGVFQGELAADVIWKNKSIDRNQDGKIQYVMLEGETEHQDFIIRTEAAVNTLRQKGIEVERLSYGIANWNRAQAQNRMSQMLGKYGEAIELVLANNDNMALGAIDAYREKGYAKEEMPVFFGIDGIKEGLRAVKEGSLAATVYNDKEGQAEVMADLVHALITGKGLDKIEFQNGNYIYLDYDKVTPENVDSFSAKEAE